MRRQVKIFDSLSHPTIDGNWILPRYKGASSVELLLRQMSEAGIYKSLAVGMKGIGSYSDRQFVDLIKPYEKLVPIAYFDFSDDRSIKELDNNLIEVKNSGYRGVKFHPRFSDFSLTSEKLAYTINKATELGLVSLLCTYFTHNSGTATNNNIDTLCKLLMNVQSSRLVLLHSGTTHFLDMIDVGRSFKDVLLDLSFTMCKYEGSSLDLDLKFAFKTFDQRVCIGADWPEFSMMKLRERFDYLTSGLSDEKINNIAYKNLENYIF